MVKKLLSLFMVLLLGLNCFYAVAFAEGTDGEATSTEKEAVSKPLANPDGLSIKAQALSKQSESRLNLVILSDGRDITAQLKKIGAVNIKKKSDMVYSATLARSKVMNLLKVNGIKDFGLDKVYTLDPKERVGLSRPIDEYKPNLETTLDDTQADLFNEKFGDGTGTVIAIIDTGVDPGHEMLQWTTNGDIKIIDWQDFSYEGDLALDTRVTVQSSVYGEVYSEVYNYVYLPDDGIKLTLPDDIPAGTELYVGKLEEEILPNEILFGYRPGPNTGFDFNLDGDKTDSYYVAAADKDGDGEPDHVYVDTNLDDAFTDEEPLIPYRDGVKENKRIMAHFPEGEKGAKVNFVLTGIWPDEDVVWVNLGFDGGSHGTHVAGIAAGNGTLKGVAPGAKIMALKVLGSNVGGATSSIMAAMEYAAEHGADVINMSLGATADINDGNSPDSLLANELTKEYGVVFAISAGNEGPGINTIGSPGDSTMAVTSGAYINKDTWEEYGDNSVPEGTEGLWWFSSIGPREDGMIKPTVVTPGSAVSSVPEWDVWSGSEYRGPYDLYQGTSMASPQTAGLVALLNGAARKEGLIDEGEHLDPVLVQQALKYSARKLDGYNAAEQGGGLAQVVDAYEYIKEHISDTTIDDLTITTDCIERIPETHGIYVRNEPLQNKYKVSITNNGDTTASINISEEADWISLSKRVINVVPGQTGSFTVYIDKNKLSKGFNSEIITLDDSATGLVDAEVPVSIVVPDELDISNNYSSSKDGTVIASKYNRYFYRVPDGTAKLTVSLKGIEKDGTVPSLRPVIFNPYGVGIDPDDRTYTTKENPRVYEIDNPLPGVWEVDVYGNFRSELSQNDYTLDVKLSGIIPKPDAWDVERSVGTTVTSNFQLTNLTDDAKDVRVSGTGLVDLNTPSKTVTKTLDLNNDDLDDDDYIEEVTITPDNPNFVFEVSIGNTSDPGADLDLYLYRWTEDGYSLVAYEADGDSNESVKLKALAPGDYLIFVDSFAIPSGKTTFDYTTRILNADSAVEGSTITIANGELSINKGATADFKATLTVPTTQSDYTGLLLVNDGEGNQLTKVGVNVKALPVTSGGGSSGGGSSGGGSSSGSSSGGTTGGTGQQPAANVIKKTVGREGGIVSTADNAMSIDIPEDAFTGDVNVEISVIEPSSVKVNDAALRIIGNVYEIKAGAELKKPVTLKLKYDRKGLNSISPKFLAVYTLNESDGKWNVVGGKVDEASDTVSVNLNHFSRYALMIKEVSFNDLNGHWAEEDIKVLASRNIISGYPDGSFKPENSVTRAEFAKMIVSALNGGIYTPQAPSFEDVKPSDWFYPYVETAKQLGIVNGFNGRFDPNGLITRQEMTAMIIRAMQQNKGEKYFPTADTQLKFKDSSNIADWAKDSVSIGIEKGIVSGLDDETFAPEAKATRAQAAVMIMRLLKSLDMI
jgi:Subtilase family./S-layer homology domain.